MSEEKADGEDGRQSERPQVAKGSSPTQTHRDPLGSTKKEEKKKKTGLAKGTTYNLVIGHKVIRELA